MSKCTQRIFTVQQPSSCCSSSYLTEWFSWFLTFLDHFDGFWSAAVTLWNGGLARVEWTMDQRNVVGANGIVSCWRHHQSETGIVEVWKKREFPLWPQQLACFKDIYDIACLLNVILLVFVICWISYFDCAFCNVIWSLLDCMINCGVRVEDNIWSLKILPNSVIDIVSSLVVGGVRWCVLMLFWVDSANVSNISGTKSLFLDDFCLEIDNIRSLVPCV